jgi:hypothetical protein
MLLIYLGFTIFKVSFVYKEKKFIKDNFDFKKSETSVLKNLNIKLYTYIAIALFKIIMDILVILYFIEVF